MNENTVTEIINFVIENGRVLPDESTESDSTLNRCGSKLSLNAANAALIIAKKWRTKQWNVTRPSARH
jgi:hypothetical protein